MAASQAVLKRNGPPFQGVPSRGGMAAMRAARKAAASGLLEDRIVHAVEVTIAGQHLPAHCRRLSRGQ